MLELGCGGTVFLFRWKEMFLLSPVPNVVGRVQPPLNEKSEGQFALFREAERVGNMLN